MNSNEIIHELHQTTRRVTKDANEHLKEHQLFQSQWSILYSLKRYGSMTQTELWRYLSVEAPTITRTLRKLEAGGWVKRQQGKDKRERIVSLTEKSILHLPAIEKSIKTHERNMLLGLTQDEQDQLLVLLRKIGRMAPDGTE